MPNITSKIEVESGCYNGLDTSDSYLIEIPANSESITVDGVEKTVITSKDTTALIVEDGNAYLYDSLADAVAAVESGRGASGDTPAAITLLKTTDETVTIDPDTKFTVKPISEDAGIENNATFETEDEAAAYAEANGGTADGAAAVSTSDASFFAAMASFIPDLATWIDNNKASGMMELE